VYALTKAGERHLVEWAEVLGNLGAAMNRFAERVMRNRSRQMTKA
jgi:DNA-binding PadR family transcriptional regulator